MESFCSCDQQRDLLIAHSRYSGIFAMKDLSPCVPMINHFICKRDDQTDVDVCSFNLHRHPHQRFPLDPGTRGTCNAQLNYNPGGCVGDSLRRARENAGIFRSPAGVSRVPARQSVSTIT